MFAVIFLLLLFLEILILKGYFDCLTAVSQQMTLKDYRSLKLGMAHTALTNLALMKDIKFFICLMTKSYNYKDIDSSLKRCLTKARRYLLLQYPVALLLVILPAIFKSLSMM